MTCASTWTRARADAALPQSNWLAANGDLDDDTLALTSDADIQGKLIAIRGIGPWTAHNTCFGRGTASRHAIAHQRRRNAGNPYHAEACSSTAAWE